MPYTQEYLVDLMLVDENGCWEWQGRIGTHGYGVLPDHSLAHRATYEAFVKEIPFKCVICHSCDYKRCCNPDHLIAESHGYNTQDAFNKGRMFNPPLKLSNDDVRIIRELLTQGVNQYEIAKRFNVRQPMISRIKTGLRRSSVTHQEPTPNG